MKRLILIIVTLYPAVGWCSLTLPKVTPTLKMQAIEEHPLITPRIFEWKVPAGNDLSAVAQKTGAQRGHRPSHPTTQAILSAA